MTLELQFKIKNNPYLIKYLHENSSWYKYLNRDPKTFKIFEEEMKEKYKLRTTDRFEQIINNLDMMAKFMSALK
mgnify:CR=1 FL=1